MFPVFSFRFTQWQLKPHVERMPFGILLVFARTDVDTYFTAGTVFDRNLNGVFLARPVLCLRVCMLEGCRCIFEMFRIIHFRADYRVRTHHCALAALDTDILFPYRYLFGQVTFFVFRRTDRKRAVVGHLAYRNGVSFAQDDCCKRVADKFRGISRYRRAHLNGTVSSGTDGDFVKVRK